MTNELRYCTKSSCWISDVLLPSGYVALWPLKLFPEKRDKFFIWSFYVRWTPERGTHVNQKWLCEKHHKQIVAMWSADTAADLREMEVTEEWLTRTNSRM